QLDPQTHRFAATAAMVAHRAGSAMGSSSCYNGRIHLAGLLIVVAGRAPAAGPRRTGIFRGGLCGLGGRTNSALRSDYLPQHLWPADRRGICPGYFPRLLGVVA